LSGLVRKRTKGWDCGLQGCRQPPCHQEVPGSSTPSPNCSSMSFLFNVRSPPKGGHVLQLESIDSKRPLRRHVYSLYHYPHSLFLVLLSVFTSEFLSLATFLLFVIGTAARRVQRRLKPPPYPVLPGNPKRGKQHYQATPSPFPNSIYCCRYLDQVLRWQHMSQ